MRKPKKNPQPQKLFLHKDPFIDDEKEEATFSDENIFINDSPRKWVANTKLDKEGLSVRQHLLIFHVTVKASWFPDDLYPTLREKCIQYHKERNLSSMGVTADSFYKSYPSIEYSYLEVLKTGKEITKRKSKYIIEEEKPKYKDLKKKIVTSFSKSHSSIDTCLNIFKTELKKTKKLSKSNIKKKIAKYKIIKKKYIELELIESVIPFILQWYLTAAFFVQTLNTASYKLDEENYYWIYRETRNEYPQKLKHFFDNHCPHLNYNTFKSIDSRKCGEKIKKEMVKYINPYIREVFPNSLSKGKK